MKRFDTHLTGVQFAKKITALTGNSTTGIVAFTLGSMAEMKYAKSQIVLNENIDYVLSSIEDEIFTEKFHEEKINEQITEFEAIIHSKKMNINPVYVRLWISAMNERKTIVKVYVASKEDLTNDNNSNSAIEEIKKRFSWTFGY